MLGNQIKESKLGKDETERMKDDLVRLEQDIKFKEEGRPEGDPNTYIMNLKDFDNMLATYNSQIDQLRSLKGLLKEYISKEV